MSITASNMATALPRPLQPPRDPPTTALPPLPTSKGRKSLPSQLASPSAATTPSRLPSAFNTPSRLRTPSKAAGIPVPSAQHASSTPTVPTLSAVSTPGAAHSNASKIATPSGDKAVKRAVSISAFPQPPKSRIGVPSGRPSLGGTINTNLDKEQPPLPPPKDTTPITPNGTLKLKKLRKQPSSNGLHPSATSAANTSAVNTGSTAPSLLNGSAESVPISAGSGTRGSDGLLSLPSPSQSRCSSAQGSYSTSATTFEDLEEVQQRGRESKRTDPGAKTAGRSGAGAGKESKGNVIVSVRVRPDEDGDVKPEGEWMVDGRRALVAFRGREGGDYYYDNVFATHDSNDKVYEACAKRLVRRVMEGYHGTVFAYGMTGTGKTFSMQGTLQSPGVIPKAITDIFSFIRETPHREFLLRASYLEIYNEEIRDLLAPLPTNGAAPEKIKLREDSKRGVFVTPLKEEIVQSPMQLLRVVARGDKARHVGTTQYNVHSSRSHAVVKIVVESRDRADATGADDKRVGMAPGGVRVSTLSLIDLAGSERAADNKERRTEGAHINKSLLTLGTVIARLSGEKDKNGSPTDRDGKHLPYRDSKLTRLLQPALSGNSLISILCTIQIGAKGSVALANNHTGETLNTLKFAARAKNNIVSHAKKAEEAISGVGEAASGLLERYRNEIQTLRRQLEDQVQVQAEKDERQLEKDAQDRHQDQLLEMQLARTALKERIEHLNRLILSSKSLGVNSSSGSAFGSPVSPNGVGAFRFGTLSALGGETSTLRSTRSSASASTIHRSPSGASTATASTRLEALRSPQLVGPVIANEPGHMDADPEAEVDNEGSEGQASLQAQVCALQSDLADKNRYIATLERRLLQARRSSHSRASHGFAVAALQEKDIELAELRSRLDDSEKRSAALDAELARLKKPVSKGRADSISSPSSPKKKGFRASHKANGSFGSVATNGSGGAIDAVGKRSPLDILASRSVGSPDIRSPLSAGPGFAMPSHQRRRSSGSSKEDALAKQPQPEPHQHQHHQHHPSSSQSSHRASKRSIEGLSRMLDEMIQEKVERGELSPEHQNSDRYQPRRIPGVAALGLNGVRTTATRHGGSNAGSAGSEGSISGTASVGALARKMRFEVDDNASDEVERKSKAKARFSGSSNRTAPTELGHGNAI